MFTHTLTHEGERTGPQDLNPGTVSVAGRPPSGGGGESRGELTASAAAPNSSAITGTPMMARSLDLCIAALPPPQARLTPSGLRHSQPTLGGVSSSSVLHQPIVYCSTRLFAYTRHPRVRVHPGQEADPRRPSVTTRSEVFVPYAGFSRPSPSTHLSPSSGNTEVPKTTPHDGGRPVFRPAQGSREEARHAKRTSDAAQARSRTAVPIESRDRGDQRAVPQGEGKADRALWGLSGGRKSAAGGRGAGRHRQACPPTRDSGGYRDGTLPRERHPVGRATGHRSDPHLPARRVCAASGREADNPVEPRRKVLRQRTEEADRHRNQ